MRISGRIHGEAMSLQTKHIYEFGPFCLDEAEHLLLRDGNAVPLTDDSGYFWFFDPTNIEAVTKVLNGCGLDNAYWVFAAGLTNVKVHLTVTDTQTGNVYTRDNAQGSAFQPIQDTAAFPASCP